MLPYITLMVNPYRFIFSISNLQNQRYIVLVSWLEWPLDKVEVAHAWLIAVVADQQRVQYVFRRR